MTRTVPDLFFGINARVLDGHARRKLGEIAPALEALLYDFPDLVIVIEGHADDRSVTEYNEQLALARADAVLRALLDRSFPQSHLRSVSLASRVPECPTEDDFCRKKNRRVHFRAAQMERETGGQP